MAESWPDVYNEMVKQWKPPTSSTAGVEWTRDAPRDDDAPTVEQLKADDPAFVPPPGEPRPSQRFGEFDGQTR